MAITYRSPPASSGISVILFFLLDDRREAIPSLVKIGTVTFKPRSGSEVAPAMGWSCIFLLFLLRPLPSKWGFYAVTKAFYRSYDVTLLPVTCLDTHAHHLVAVSMDAGYKRRKFPSQRQLSPDGWQVSTSPHCTLPTTGPLPPGIYPEPLRHCNLFYLSLIWHSSPCCNNVCRNE